MTADNLPPGVPIRIPLKSTTRRTDIITMGLDGSLDDAFKEATLNGNALETSMEVELTVDVIPNKHIGDP